MCLDVSSWEVFSLLPSADYTEYLIYFSNWHSWEFGNTVKKDVRRSWEERWREIAGESWSLINRRSHWLFGSLKHISLSPSLPVVLIVLDFALYSQTYNSIHSHLQYITSAFNSGLCSLSLPLCLSYNSKLLCSHMNENTLYGPKFFKWKKILLPSWTIQPSQLETFFQVISHTLVLTDCSVREPHGTALAGKHSSPI